MGRKLTDHTGKQFGHWTVVDNCQGYVNKYGSKNRQVIAECICGKKKLVYFESIRAGRSLSCGCKRKPTYNMPVAKHPLYRVRVRLRQSCYNVVDNYYPMHGKIGITICDQWDDFNQFVSDVSPKPKDKTNITYLDKNKPVGKDNFKWI